MSRVGKNAVEVPDGVQVELAGQLFKAKGKLGERSLRLADDVDVKIDGRQVHVAPRTESLRARTMWGTTRNLVRNIVEGVAKGFVAELEITGVGYRAALQGKELVLQLGYSHDVDFPVPEGIEIKTPDNTTVEISGIDKQQVGQVAAEIRRWRKPEPYKGKGIKYRGEFIFRKEGKKK